MRDILIDLMRWQKAGDPVVLATVIQTWGSSPRRAGAKMAFTSEGRISGSVSGGCVEAAVVEAGLESLKTDRPQLLHFGVADETAWEVGLACGGSIEVFVKPIDREFLKALQPVIEAGDPAVIATVVQGPDALLGRELLYQQDGHVTGTLGSEWHEPVLRLAEAALSEGVSRRVRLNEEVEVFLEVLLPAPALILVGGVHIAVALVSLAKTLGYRTIVIDPRQAWGNDERFPQVDQLIQAWPEQAFEQVKVTRSTAIAMLTHDPKLDDPALKIALNSPAFYVGALGSRSTHAKRRQRLSADGLSESQLSRLHAPIGLDIGSQTPAEIALAIMAEVVDSHRKQDPLAAAREAVPHPTED
jgi:xanthine dehydrogenase accessory factor